MEVRGISRPGQAHASRCPPDTAGLQQVRGEGHEKQQHGACSDPPVRHGMRGLTGWGYSVSGFLGRLPLLATSERPPCISCVIGGPARQRPAA